MTTQTVSNRLQSLDALRGFTVAGMILVNTPGSWEHIYAPFRHAEFNGLTLADLVFPFFLFIVGASIALAMGKRVALGDSKAHLIVKIAKRSAIIFSLGVLLNWLSADFGEIRIAGVLQRIGVCYLVVSLLFLFVSSRWQIVAGVVILLAYWVLCVFVDVPGHGLVFTHEMNWPAWVDGKLLPGKMYFGNWDPEGILSTLPAIVTALCGVWAVGIISKSVDFKQKITRLSIYGAAIVVAGLLLALSFPINKNVWSSSFVLVTAGLASLLWSMAIYVVDEKRQTRWVFPGLVFGANAITAYVLHYLLAYPLSRIPLAGNSIQGHFMAWLGGIVPPEMASLAWAVLYTSLCFVPIYAMYKKKLFVKI